MSHWPDPKLLQALTIDGGLLPPKQTPAQCPGVTVDWSQVKAWPEPHSPAATELDRLRKLYAKGRAMTQGKTPIEQSVEHTQLMYTSPIVRAKRAINRYVAGPGPLNYGDLEQFILEEIQGAIVGTQSTIRDTNVELAQAVTNAEIRIRALEAQVKQASEDLAIAQQSLAGAKQVIRTYAAESAYNPATGYEYVPWAFCDMGRTARDWLSKLKRRTACA